jgi:hypothetical protein
MRRESVKSRIHPYFFCVAQKMLQGLGTPTSAVENAFRIKGTSALDKHS